MLTQDQMEARLQTLLSKYSEETLLANQLAKFVIKSYTTRNRYYHNLTHIAALLDWSDEYASYLQQKEIVDLAIFYHDVIYNPLRRDNEARSAILAMRDLRKLNFPPPQMNEIENFILATAKHDLGNADAESDLAYFLDFDLAILGTDWESYLLYTQQIRKEYSIYPDFIYNEGRKKVLQSFLSKPHIFHTEKIIDQLEAQARSNLAREINLL